MAPRLKLAKNNVRKENQTPISFMNMGKKFSTIYKKTKQQHIKS
jgi:hypothetical protein